jgi:hypothetical protein
VIAFSLRGFLSASNILFSVASISRMLAGILWDVPNLAILDR